MFPQKMLNNIMKKEYRSSGYRIELLYRGQETFTHFIDILIETKQGYLDSKNK